MNEDNVRKAIAVMQRALGRVSMMEFQTVHKQFKYAEFIAKTEAELHTCGSKACFAGHLGISPEWIADGGGIDDCGVPENDNHYGASSIAQWLGVEYNTASALIMGRRSAYHERTQRLADEHCRFYGKRWGDVDADDVIAKLKMILSGELA